HTSEAGYHLAATAEQNGVRLIAVVLGTKSDEDRNEQVTQLLNYGFRAFERVIAARQGEPVGERRLRSGNPERFTVEAAADLPVLIPRGRQGDLRRAVQWLEDVDAPLERGERVGILVAYLGDEPLAQVDVIAAQDVGRACFFTRLWRTVWGGLARRPRSGRPVAGGGGRAPRARRAGRDPGRLSGGRAPGSGGRHRRPGRGAGRLLDPPVADGLGRPGGGHRRGAPVAVEWDPL